MTLLISISKLGKMFETGGRPYCSVTTPQFKTARMVIVQSDKNRFKGVVLCKLVNAGGGGGLFLYLFRFSEAREREGEQRF